MNSELERKLRRWQREQAITDFGVAFALLVIGFSLGIALGMLLWG